MSINDRLDFLEREWWDEVAAHEITGDLADSLAPPWVGSVVMGNSTYTVSDCSTTRSNPTPGSALTMGTGSLENPNEDGYHRLLP